jgi:hypothetical protein
MGFIERITRLISDRDQLAAIGQAFTGERASARYGATLMVRFEGAGPMVGRRGNLGIGGFCFEGENLYGKGARIEMKIRLPGVPGALRAVGEVLGHTSRHGYLGVRGRFTEISFEDERILARWLDGLTLGALQPQVA